MRNVAISLMELNQQIKKAVKENISACWIIAEISDLKINYSGHCYLELVQKDEDSDQVVARSKAAIWSSFFRMINPYFESTTGQALRAGLKIMIKVTAEFHELYGMNLSVTDIEPTYTVGEMALRRQKIIQQLQDEGVFEMNKELGFPYLLRKIAVISSLTAAGFEDFTDQLLNNPAGYRFYCKLFPAVMQGAEAEESIVAALENIYRYENFFDAVVIIRGGGSKIDLSCFDSYRLAYHITQFPLPVITGIGHEQDDSVVDLVAHTRLKTPTAVAAFLIDHMAELDGNLQLVQEQILQKASEIVDETLDYIHNRAKDLQLFLTRVASNEETNLLALKHKLAVGVNNSIYRLKIDINKCETQITHTAKRSIERNKSEMQYFLTSLDKTVHFSIDKNKSALDLYSRQISQLDPQVLLKKGYSVTFKDGRIISDSDEANEGELIETILYKGKLVSQIKTK